MPRRRRLTGGTLVLAIECILLGMVIGLVVAPAPAGSAGKGGLFDNGPAIERQNQDADRYQQEQFRQDQRDRWSTWKPC